MSFRWTNLGTSALSTPESQPGSSSDSGQSIVSPEPQPTSSYDFGQTPIYPEAEQIPDESIPTSPPALCSPVRAKLPGQTPVNQNDNCPGTIEDPVILPTTHSEWGPEMLWTNTPATLLEMLFEDSEVVEQRVGAPEEIIQDEDRRVDDATRSTDAMKSLEVATKSVEAVTKMLEAATTGLNELQVAARADLQEWRVERERMVAAERARVAAITPGNEAKQPHDQQMKWLEKLKAELLAQVREMMRDIADRTDELAASAIRERALEKSLRKLKVQLAKQPPAGSDDGRSRLEETSRTALKFTFAARAQDVRTRCTTLDTSLLQGKLNWFSGWSDIARESEEQGFQSGAHVVRRDQRGNTLGLCTTHDVAFAHPFEAPPRVVVWLTGVEMMKDRVWRVRVSARAIRNSGFEIAVERWGDAPLYVAGVAWVAYPAMQKGVCSGTFETAEAEGWKSALFQGKGSETLTAPFERRARVMVAVNEIEAEVEAGLEIEVGVVGERAAVDWCLDVEGSEGRVFSVKGVWVALDGSLSG